MQCGRVQAPRQALTTVSERALDTRKEVFQSALEREDTR